MRLQQLAVASVGLPFGDVLVARCPAAPHPIVGAVVGLRPDRLVPAEVWAELRQLEEPLLGDRLGAAREAGERTAHLRPAGPLLTIAMLGVHPGHRRRGLDTRLLQPLLDVADSVLVGSYLKRSSGTNVTLDQRVGFQVIDRTEIPASPTVWAMRRPTRPDHGPRRQIRDTNTSPLSAPLSREFPQPVHAGQRSHNDLAGRTTDP